MTNKTELRKQIRALKRAMTEEEIAARSEKLGQLFRQCEQYQKADTIYGYLPYNQEVRTVPILQMAIADGKRVAVPKVYGDDMKFRYITDFSQVEISSMGIPEPLDTALEARDCHALVLMPGLAFDAQGHRIGYGGGFYDRFLQLEPEHPTVALCYSFQMMPALETEAFDIPVDAVLWA